MLPWTFLACWIFESGGGSSSDAVKRSKIQEVKYRARGYRNRANFRRAILFHCGGLDLYPR